MAQVPVNLLTRAIQSLMVTPGRARSMTIPSPDGQDVLRKVSDNPIAITAERLEHIFEVVFTTKPKGTGMGLSLCRTLVEKRGDRPWASQRAPNGATFHRQMSRSRRTVP
jgi:C4-dicarboxylate-specific signal transduction histidine kinase